MTSLAPRGGPSPLPPVAEATRAATYGLAAAALGLAVAYAVAPGHRQWLSAPNGLTDLATAVLLAATVLVGIWALRRTPGDARWRRLLPLAALLGLLDELHLGTSLVHFDLPRIGPVTLDGISALFAAVQHVAETQLGLGPLDLVAGSALLAAVAAYLLARHRRAPRAAAWLVDHPPAVHLLVAVFLVTLAVALDLLAGEGVAGFVEEWLEFAAAGLVARGTLLIPRREPEALGWRQRLRPWLAVDSPQRAMPSGAPRRPGE